MIAVLYIDPGTGSMLFAILISVLSAVYFTARTTWVKLKFLLNGGKKVAGDEKKIPLVVYSDDKRYWNVFKPICMELMGRGQKVTYLTSSSDDPALELKNVLFSASYIGEGNKPFAKLNFLNANVLVSTTPGLDVYQWKRSKGIDYYVHVLHAANEIAGYRMFGIDYYDALLLSGDYQVRDARNLEKLRNLKEKEIRIVGLPYMDEMVKRLDMSEKVVSKERTVLLAPSWGPSSILNKFGEAIIDELIKTGYHIIIRPHPQSFTSEKEMIERLMSKYPDSDKLEWNRDNDNFDVLNKSDILISDFSGVVFDYTLVFDKPLIYADTEFDKAPYDAWWLDTPYWTMTAVERLGEKLTKDNLKNIKNIIDECINNPKYAEKRLEVRNETWQKRGEGARLTADFLMEKIKEFSETKEE